MNRWTAKEWAEVVMAWIMGGLIGRLFGHTYLVGYLGWPEVFGWLSVPIGSAIAWMAVEVKAIVPAIKHAYRWTKKPVRLVNLAESFSRAQKHLMKDCHKFKDNWGWRVFNATSVGLLIGFWLVALSVLATITEENCKKDAFNFLLLMAMYAFVSLYTAIIRDKLLEYMGWDRFFNRPQTGNRVINDAMENFFNFLVYNPVSVYGILLLIAIPYYLAIGVKEVIVWLGKVIWKTILMINSSRRMVAMTGAAIGLSISQIYGYSPVICGVVCVLAGLAERMVFGFAERTVQKLTAKQTA